MTDTPEAAPMREYVTLLPCPFCGAAPLLLGLSDSDSFGQVGCENPDCLMQPGTDAQTSAEAVAHWNTRLAHTARPDAAPCSAGPDHADILETIENAADNWQANGYASALAEVRDMANVGRSLIEALPTGYCYMDSPAEIVTDLQNKLDEALTARPDAGDEAEVSLLRGALAEIAAEAWVPLSELPHWDQPNGWRKIAVERIEIARAAIAAMGEGAATGMPSDMRRLVVAARIVTDQGDDPHNEEMRELLDAVEAFSSRVPYEERSFSSLHAAVRSEGGGARPAAKTAPMRESDPRLCLCQNARRAGFPMMCLVCTGPVGNKQTTAKQEGGAA